MNEDQARMILGVGPNAGYAECRRGYHDAMRRWHTDVRGDTAPNDERAAQLVNEAWEFMQSVFADPSAQGQHCAQRPGRQNQSQSPKSESHRPTRSNTPRPAVRWAIVLFATTAIVAALGFGGRAIYGVDTGATNEPRSGFDAAAATETLTPITSATTSAPTSSYVTTERSDRCQDAYTEILQAGTSLKRLSASSSSAAIGITSERLKSTSNALDYCSLNDPTAVNVDRAKELVEQAISAVGNGGGPCEYAAVVKRYACLLLPGDVASIRSVRAELSALYSQQDFLRPA